MEDKVAGALTLVCANESRSKRIKSNQLNSQGHVCFPHLEGLQWRRLINLATSSDLALDWRRLLNGLRARDLAGGNGPRFKSNATSCQWRGRRSDFRHSKMSHLSIEFAQLSAQEAVQTSAEVYQPTRMLIDEGA